MIPFPKLSGKIILAPMHDVTNLAFRLMCKKYGASLVSTELLSANPIARGNNAVIKTIITDKKEKPVVIQLFGQNTENLIKARKARDKTRSYIDDMLAEAKMGKIIDTRSAKTLVAELASNIVENLDAV